MAKPGSDLKYGFPLAHVTDGMFRVTWLEKVIMSLLSIMAEKIFKKSWPRTVTVNVAEGNAMALRMQQLMQGIMLILKTEMNLWELLEPLLLRPVV